MLAGEGTAGEPPPTLGRAPAALPAPAPPGPPAPPAVAVDATFRITGQDVFRAASEAARHTWLSAGFGFALVFGGFFWASRDDITSLAIAALGVGFSTGWLSGLIAVLNTRRRPDLLARDHRLHVDAAGIRWVAPEATSETAWRYYRRIREMRGDFLLDAGTGSATFVPKRGLRPVEVEVFRHLALRAGLLTSGSSWTKPVIGYAVGVAACAALYIAAYAIIGR